MRTMGQAGGAEGHALTVDEMPLHSHTVNDHVHSIPSLSVDVKASSAAATTTTAAGNVLATATLIGGGGPKVTAIGANTGFAGGTTTSVGNGKAYATLPPYLAVNCIIAMQGAVPVP